MYSGIILSTAYLPPVQYISKFLAGFPVYIEKHENYQKQSYRNRCYIYGANGRQMLAIPVKKHHYEKTPVSLVEIDYATPWQKIHMKSIESAYRLSAFYEYYADDFMALYDLQPRFLPDWNHKLLSEVLDMLGIPQKPVVTETWEKEPENFLDFRQGIHPKSRLIMQDDTFTPHAYQQVFQERHGFLENLSIIDLLFNEGPRASAILKDCLVMNL
jgi:hypothetical protein